VKPLVSGRKENPFHKLIATGSTVGNSVVGSQLYTTGAVRRSHSIVTRTRRAFFHPHDSSIAECTASDVKSDAPRERCKHKWLRAAFGLTQVLSFEIDIKTRAGAGSLIHHDALLQDKAGRRGLMAAKEQG
jgi:hypothetical protein